MRLTRIYQAVTLHCGESLTLDAQSAAHVAKVLRLAPGDPIVIFNGEGGEYRGSIESVGKRCTTVLLESFENKEVESSLQIVLGQCMSRGERMDYAIQKSVELGVTSIYPLDSQRCGVHIPAERMEKRRLHWQRVAISACEQCGRNRVPQVHAISDLDSWIAAQGSSWSYILDPEAGLGVKQLNIPADASIRVLIGPEGGLTAAEITLATKSSFKALRLGPRILRSETAAVATLCALQTFWGDLA
ncbi:MAG: 16S rRNA (uracil(1498)-N(3))-methyltransferase [Thiohalomonadales bacterium]